jgi:CubicO group peptidase (beta-lactamase class C family)
MRSLVAALLLVTLTADTRPREARALERLVPRLMRDGRVPGLSLVLIHDREIAWERAYGVADDAIFESASLGKPVFAYAVLKLVDAGVLALDVPLSQYLDEPVSDPRMKQITARMVLTHTTGYQNEVMPGKTLQVHFEPGSRFSYSGAGFLRLQRVVEHVTGKPLPALMRELVFAPLGMHDSGYVWLPEYERRKVYGHDRGGQRIERRRPAAATMATLHTTPRDYARFTIAIMKGTGLQPATAAAMISPQVPVDASCHTCLHGGSGTPSPSLSCGLAWGIEKTARGTSFWHWGENNGDTHTFVMARDDGRAIVVFANSGNGHSIMPELVAAALGGEHPAFAWMGYESYRAR